MTTKLMQKHVTRPVYSNFNESSNMYFIGGLIWALPKATPKKIVRIN